MEQTVSYIRKTNVEFLITGYSRESCGNEHVPSSVSNVIKSYYPKMSGHEFKWNIKDKDLIKEIIKYNQLQTFESDVFDVGLSNKFFLQLQPYSRSTQSVDRGQGQGQVVAGYENCIQTTSSLINSKSNIILNLMSFPLPSKYKSVVFHCELYFNEINAEYSTIWETKNKERKLILNQRQYRGMRPYENQIDDNKYTKFGWVIDYDLNRYNFDEMTFQCKINILKIIKNDISVQPDIRYQHMAHFNNDNNKKSIDLYSYESVYNSQTKKNMKFVWNITEKYILDRLIGHSDYKGIIQYHSDVFYDIFQLKMSRENDVNYFMISICGLPPNTHIMGVKIELFAMKYACNDNKNKIKIVSKIITFSYDEPIHTLSKNQTEILVDLLMNYKQLSLFCIANIIQKYDANNETVNDKVIGPIFGIINENQTTNMKEIRKQISLSKQKIIKLSQDTFIWHFSDFSEKDNDLLNKIKESISKKQAAKFDSAVFKLCKHKWYITILTKDDTILYTGRPAINEDQIAIFLNCLSNIPVNCKISISLIQTNNTKSFYDLGTRRVYGPGHVQGMYMDPLHSLMQNGSSIMTLNEMSVKVDISVIDDDINDVEHYYPPRPGPYNPYYGRVREYIDNDNKDDDVTVIKEEVKKWLIKTVELPNYLKLFQKHSIEDLNIVKLLTMDSLQMMGITRIGHQLKILHQIDILKQLKK